MCYLSKVTPERDEDIGVYSKKVKYLNLFLFICMMLRFFMFIPRCQYHIKSCKRNPKEANMKTNVVGCTAELN